MPPANGAMSRRAVLTLRIAECPVFLLIWLADERRSCGAAITFLGTRDANVSHLRRAVWRAHATPNVMEVLPTLGVPQEPVLLTTTGTLMLLTQFPVPVPNSPPISLRLMAESPIIPERTRAVLPANRSHSDVVVAAKRIAKRPVFLFARRTSRDDFTNSTPLCQLPTTLNIFRSQEHLCIKCSHSTYK